MKLNLTKAQVITKARMPIAWKQQKLQEMPLLAGLPNDLAHYIATHANDWHASTIRPFYLKNEPETYIGFILSGHLYHVLHGEDGKEVIHYTNHPGEIIGETALLDPQKRCNSAYAEEKSYLLVLNKHHFPVLQANPQLMARMQGLLCRRLRQTIDFVEATCLFQLESRLARYFLTQISHYGIQHPEGILIPPPPNQSTLAAMVNASRPKLNAQLQKWLRTGLLQRQTSSILISDIKKMKQIAMNN